jgi:sulfite reductase alpha subunit-like flavoprotein
MDSPLPLESRSLVVLHASMTGTAVDVAERIGRVGRRNGWSVAVKGVGEFDRVSVVHNLEKKLD